MVWTKQVSVMEATGSVVRLTARKISRAFIKRHDLSLRYLIMTQSTIERRHTMFWTFLMFTGLALVFAQLGAYSVLVAVLAGGLKIALLVIAGFVIVLLWRKVFQKNT